MTSASRSSFVSRVLVLLALCGAFAAVGCTEDKPAPISTGGGADEDAGDGNNGKAGKGGSGNGGSGIGGGDDGGLDSSVATDGGGGGDVDSAVALPTSPTNPWIAYVQIDVNSAAQLYFVKADGTGGKKFKGVNSELDPTWSPDGKRLAFIQYKAGTGNSLHVLDFAKGTDTEVTSAFQQLTRPRWSPDGSLIVVAGTTAAVSVPSLFRVDPVSGDSVQLTESMMGDGGHDVSADGTVYFVRKGAGSKYEVYTVSVGGDPSETPEKVTDNSGVVGGVTVNPDGKRFYFARNVNNNTQIIERAISDGAEKMIGETGDEEVATFSGGDKLVLNRDSFDSDSEIAVVEADGKLIKQLTDEEFFDVAPAVCPLEADDVSLAKF